MAKKIIKIFIGSSIVEFEKERLLLERFIRNVSDDFEAHYGIKIQPMLCENFDPAFDPKGKQKAYDDVACGCDLCFFLFFTKAGQYTVEEFEAARKSLEDKGNPKIYTYFKEVAEGEAEQSVRDFMERLDKALGHYYSRFSDLDTVKLRILLCVKLAELDFVEIKTEGGRCVLDGKVVKDIDLSKVTEFVNNKELAVLSAELERVEKEYFELKGKNAALGADTELAHRFLKVALRRQELKDAIEELQGLVFKLSARMVEDSARGIMDEQLRTAYALFEQGDYEGCLRVLDFKDIKSDSEKRRARHAKEQEQYKKECRLSIKKHRTAIDILSAMSGLEDRFALIEERYEEIVIDALDANVDADIVCDYISYLNDQNKDQKALSLGARLEKHYDYFGATDSDKATLYNLLGIINNDVNSPLAAEEYYLKAIKLKEGLYAENPERYGGDLAMSYNNAGNFYQGQGKAGIAEEYYLKAIKLKEGLYAENPERYGGTLADSYNNAGIFYKNQGKAGVAEEYYLKAIKLYEGLYAENPERYAGGLAMSYNNAGNFYKDQGQGKAGIAEEYCLKAIKLYEGLYAENPERYAGGLAMSYNNAGIFYDDQGEAGIAEEYCLKAIKLKEGLAKRNPARYNPDLAASYFNYAIFKKDVSYLEKALSLAKTRPDHPYCRQIIKALEG